MFLEEAIAASLKRIMRTCSYLFLMPILSQEGNGDVTNLAVRDDAVTKPGSVCAASHSNHAGSDAFCFHDCAFGLRCSVAVFAPIPDCIMRCGTFLRRALRLGNLALSEKRLFACFIAPRMVIIGTLLCIFERPGRAQDL